MSPATDTTQLLIDARAGDEAASRLLSRHLHDTLRAIMQQRAGLGATRDAGTVSPVHEAYQRLVDTSRAGMDGRAHFLTLAVRAMRFMLVDRARARTARRRGAGEKNQGNASEIAADERSAELLALSDALDELTNLDPRLGGTASLHFFGGLGFNEVSEISGRPAATVRRDWIRARAWLYRAMRDPGKAPLTRPRWREIDEPLARALELGAAERATYLNGLKAGDLGLHRAVNELLAGAEEAEAVLGERATTFAAPLVADLSGDDWGDATPASVRGEPTTSLRPLIEPGSQGQKAPLAAAFSVVLLLIAIAVAGVLLKDRDRPAPEAPAVEPMPAADTAPVDTVTALSPQVPDTVVTVPVEGTVKATIPPPHRPTTPPERAREGAEGAREGAAVSSPSPDSLLGLARSSRRAGRNAEAEKALRDALAIGAEQGQASTLSTAAIQWELGDLLRAGGRYDEAGRLLKASLATRQRLAPPGSGAVAQSLAALALYECEQGRKPVADSLFRQATAIYRRLPASADSGTPLVTARAECR